jgi:adenosylcobinamide-GDP ribazoletransferase
MLKSFTAALSFLTIIRVPLTQSILTAEELAASFSCFPLAGLILGLIYYGTAVILKGSVPALLLSVLIPAVMVLLTRGLHFDGLADLADGLWGGSTPERRLEIMKDSRSGAFGVLALIFAVAFKIASIHQLISAGCLTPLLIAPVFSRFAMVAAAYRSRYARSEGLGKPFLECMRTEHLILGAVFTTLAAAATGLYSLFYFIPVLGLVYFLRFISNKYLGGITGDVLGSVNELSEILVLLIAACLIKS